MGVKDVFKKNEEPKTTGIRADSKQQAFNYGVLAMPARRQPTGLSTCRSWIKRMRSVLGIDGFS